MTTHCERPRDLAARVEAAFADNARDFVRYHMQHHPSAGAAYVDLDTGVACFGGRFAGPNVGRCWGWGMGGTPSDADLDAAEAFYAERARTPGFFVGPYADTGLLRKLQERGYGHQRMDVVLCGDVRQLLEQGAPDRLRQISLEEEHDRALLQRGYREAYGVDRSTDEIAAIAAALASGNAAFFVLEEGRELLGLCTVWSAGGVAYLMGSGVLPAHRGQGLQRELAIGRLRWAAARGADLALVTVAPGTASELNMRRLGLTPAWTGAVWERALPARERI